VTITPTTATLLPLLSAFGYAVAAIILKRATEGGAGPWRIGFVVNMTMGALFQTFWLFDDGQGGPFTTVAVLHALIVGAVFFAGQYFTFLALSRGDVSVTTPVLGAKVLFVAFLAALTMGQGLTTEIWIATVMTCVAMALLGGEWRTDRERALRSLLYGGLAALLFATSDILTQRWVGELGMTHFAPLAFGAMLLYSWLLVPKFSAPLLALPVRTLLMTVAGGALLWLQCTGMVVAISLGHEVTRTNILYNTRGIWSVVLVWVVGHWFGNVERSVGRAVMTRRLLGAAILLGAVFLVRRS
jgi:drug/metabolite transporter (DMT)-like permease